MRENFGVWFYSFNMDVSLDDIITSKKPSNAKGKIVNLNVRKQFQGNMKQTGIQRINFKPKQPAVAQQRRPISAPNPGPVKAKVGPAPAAAQNNKAAMGGPGKGQIDARDMITIKNRIKMSDARTKIIQKRLKRGNLGAQPLMQVPPQANQGPRGPGPQGLFVGQGGPGAQPRPPFPGPPGGQQRFQQPPGQPGVPFQPPRPLGPRQGPRMNEQRAPLFNQPQQVRFNRPPPPRFNQQQGPGFRQQRPPFGGQQPQEFNPEQNRPFGLQPPLNPDQGPPFNPEQGPPFNQQGQPFNQQGPVAQQGPPFNQQGPPFGQQGPPFHQPGLPANEQGLPFNQQEPSEFNQQRQPFNQDGPPPFQQGPQLDEEASFGEDMPFNPDQPVPFSQDHPPQFVNQQGPQFRQPPPQFNQQPPQFNMGPRPQFNRPGPPHMNQNQPPPNVRQPPPGAGQPPSGMGQGFMQPPGDQNPVHPDFNMPPPGDFVEPEPVLLYGVAEEEEEEIRDLQFAPGEPLADGGTVVEDTGFSLKITRSIPDVTFDGQNLTVTRRMPQDSQFQEYPEASFTDSQYTPEMNINNGPFGAPQMNVNSGPFGAPQMNVNSGPFGAPQMNVNSGPFGAPQMNVNSGPFGTPQMNIASGPFGTPQMNIASGPHGKPQMNFNSGPHGQPQKKKFQPIPIQAPASDSNGKNIPQKPAPPLQKEPSAIRPPALNQAPSQPPSATQAIKSSQNPPVSHMTKPWIKTEKTEAVPDSLASQQQSRLKPPPQSPRGNYGPMKLVLSRNEQPAQDRTSALSRVQQPDGDRRSALSRIHLPSQERGSALSRIQLPNQDRGSALSRIQLPNQERGSALSRIGEPAESRTSALSRIQQPGPDSRNSTMSRNPQSDPERGSALSRIQPDRSSGMSRVQQQAPGRVMARASYPAPNTRSPMLRAESHSAPISSRLSHAEVPMSKRLAPYASAPSFPPTAPSFQPPPAPGAAKAAVKRPPSMSLSQRFTSGGGGNPIPVITDHAPMKKRRASEPESVLPEPEDHFQMKEPIAEAEDHGTTVLSPLQGYRILVSNLHTTVTQDDIIELFGVIGPLKRANVLAKGQAEVAFIHKEHAVASLKTYHNRELDGQPMFVKLMTPLNAKVMTAPSPEDSSPSLPLSLRSSKPPAASSAPVEIPLIHKALFKTASEAVPTKAVRFTVKL